MDSKPTRRPSVRVRGLQYDKMKDYIEGKECTLLTTKDEYIDNQLNCKSFYKIIGVCGHESMIKYDMFQAQNCGLKCKECRATDIKTKLKALSISASDTEYNGFCYIRDQVASAFAIKKLVEGTLADFVVKPLNVAEDLWLPIQLKTSNHIKREHSSNYSFSMGQKNYPDMAIILLCLEDKKMWLINGNDLLVKNNVSIGGKKSKYSQYEVVHIIEALEDKYNTMNKQSFNESNQPKSIFQQQEQFANLINA